MNMEETNIPDYKLDEGFLKETMFEMLEKPSAEDITVKLPVSVQVIQNFKSTGAWNSYILVDGEFKMSRCVFMSKQAKPQRFSILKITKISKLPLQMRSDNQSLYRLGEIEFETQVSGEEIGISLYKGLKEMNMRELMKRNEEIGFTNLKETFEPPKPVELMKGMWENKLEKFCDVKFTFEGVECNDDSVVVCANKSVLVEASEVFKAHFDNDGFVDNNSVHIVDASPYSFNKLLEFIYTGKVQFTSWRLAFELLYLSKKYLISHLEKLCQDVITEFCYCDCENPLKVFEQNKKINDEVIQQGIEIEMICELYEVINSKSFLSCEFSTVEWVLSFDSLDDWSKLCAIYKWSLHNKVTAFCQKVADETDEPRNCLHALLECVRYENIDGLDLQRFLKLPKLPEIIDVSELKQSVFDGLLEDGSYLDIGTNRNCSSFYAEIGTNRNCSSFYAEIEIGRSEEKEMKNIHLSGNGPVLGFKVKQENLNIGEHSLDLVLSFRYLYSKDEKKEANMYFKVVTLKTKSIREEWDENVSYVERSFKLTQEWHQFRMDFKDYRGYVSDKIEDFGVSSGSANKSKILSLNMDIELYTQCCRLLLKPVLATAGA